MKNHLFSERKNRCLQRIFSVFFMFLLILCASSCLRREHPPQPAPAPAPTGNVPAPHPVPPAPNQPPAPDSSSAVTLHLIIVAVTNDSTIGSSVAVDASNMQELMENIVSQSNGELVLRKIVLTGDSATRSNMLRAIEYPKVKPNDAIVFLYAGHGHRSQSTATRWPLMDTPGGTTDFAEVIEKIKSKNSRQFIALADCCNKVVERAPERVFRRQFTLNQIRKMFADSQAQFAASGCKPGQLSYGDNNDGGLFTSSFVSGLAGALGSAPSGWDQVFEKVVSDVRMKSKQAGAEQTPQYEKFR